MMRCVYCYTILYRVGGHVIASFAYGIWKNMEFIALHRLLINEKKKGTVYEYTIISTYDDDDWTLSIPQSEFIPTANETQDSGEERVSGIDSI